MPLHQPVTTCLRGGKVSRHCGCQHCCPEDELAAAETALAEAGRAQRWDLRSALGTLLGIYKRAVAS